MKFGYNTGAGGYKLSTYQIKEGVKIFCSLTVDPSSKPVATGQQCFIIILSLQ